MDNNYIVCYRCLDDFKATLNPKEPQLASLSIKNRNHDLSFNKMNGKGGEDMQSILQNLSKNLAEARKISKKILGGEEGTNDPQELEELYKEEEQTWNTCLNIPKFNFSRLISEENSIEENKIRNAHDNEDKDSDYKNINEEFKVNKCMVEKIEEEEPKYEETQRRKTQEEITEDQTYKPMVDEQEEEEARQIEGLIQNHKYCGIATSPPTLFPLSNSSSQIVEIEAIDTSATKVMSAEASEERKRLTTITPLDDYMGDDPSNEGGKVEAILKESSRRSTNLDEGGLGFSNHPSTTGEINTIGYRNSDSLSSCIKYLNGVEEGKARSPVEPPKSPPYENLWEEIKGRARLDAFKKNLQELTLS
eukprot:Gb_40090 [translate_table: standard]